MNDPSGSGARSRPRSPSLRAVFFDLDGTLIDAQASIVACMQEAWRRHGLTPPPVEAVRRAVGLVLVEAVASLLEPGAGIEAQVLTDTYRAVWGEKREAGELHEPLYPGIVELLDALAARALLLGVVTGRSRRGTEGALQRHGLRARFATLQTADDGPGKPAPGLLLQALDDVGVAPAQALMVGDTVYDMRMAGNAGVRSVGVGWGYHAAEELRRAGAVEVVTSAAELLALVDGQR